MYTAKTINTIASFCIEITMLLAMGIAGYHMGMIQWLQILLATAVPLLVVVIWGIWAAPKSRRRLSRPGLTLFKIMLFSITAVLLYVTGYVSAALIFDLLSYSNEILAVRWKQ